MTREEKLWTMTGKTLLGIAEGMGLDVNKNILKQGKEKLIAKILEAEKKLENGSNNKQMEAPEEQTAPATSAEVSEEPIEETTAESEESAETEDQTEESAEESAKEPKIGKKKGTPRVSLKIKELTYNGRTQTIREWAEELGMPWATLYDRVNRNNWSVEDAIEIPLGQRRKA